ncbi:MAG: hypothetical protein ACPGVO_21515 [Spirulinaceae cyanobacterium]
MDILHPLSVVAIAFGNAQSAIVAFLIDGLKVLALIRAIASLGS